MKKKAIETIFYEYPSLSSFARIDIEYLRKEYRVLQKTLPWAVKWKTPLCFLRQFFFLILNFRRIDCVIVTFVGYHSYLPMLYARLRKIPAFVILNGTDSVGIPELGYGSHLKKVLRFFCKRSIKMASELWPVSKHLIHGENEFTGVKLLYGVGVSFPDLNKPYTVIPNGFDIPYWTNGPAFEERKGIVTIISGAGQFRLKGVDLLVDVAKQFPDLPFTVIGADVPAEISVPPNVHFTGRLEKETLKKLLYKNQFYTQLSSFEGFGCSLCEAMLTGCIPIGSNVNAIPEIIGESGFILHGKKSNEFTNLLSSVLKETDAELQKRSQLAKERIATYYTIELRMHQMKECMNRYS